MDGYENKQRSDVTTEHKKETIDAFFRRLVPISPIKRDAVKFWHPEFPCQLKVKQTMHRFETMDELWLKFKNDHPNLAEGYQSETKPNTCPKIIWDNAPWEMRSPSF